MTVNCELMEMFNPMFLAFLVSTLDPLSLQANLRRQDEYSEALINLSEKWLFSRVLLQTLFLCIDIT